MPRVTGYACDIVEGPPVPMPWSFRRLWTLPATSSACPARVPVRRAGGSAGRETGTRCPGGDALPARDPQWTSTSGHRADSKGTELASDIAELWSDVLHMGLAAAVERFRPSEEEQGARLTRPSPAGRRSVPSPCRRRERRPRARRVGARGRRVQDRLGESSRREVSIPVTPVRRTDENTRNTKHLRSFLCVP